MDVDCLGRRKVKAWLRLKGTWLMQAIPTTLAEIGFILIWEKTAAIASREPFYLAPEIKKRMLFVVSF